ncbi:MAG TPA: hypothetical protein VGC76_07460 [Pyrinomonadaceae bacterium]
MASILFLTLLGAERAQAHVKWFVEFDVSKSPKPIGEVLSGDFVKMFLLSAAGVYVFFLLDRYLYEKGILAEFDKKMKMFDDRANLIMRVAAGIFFLSLFVWYQVYGTSFYLTPELKTTAFYVPWLHLVMALCVVVRRSAPITGVGVFILYVAAARDYGIFHMLDYMIFLGIGYYLLTSSAKSKNLLKSGLVVLFACTGLTLIWASIEKFAYADWTNPLFEKNPQMLMGMTPARFMMTSGFVEFFVTFILLGAVSVVGRLISLGFLSIFVLAVVQFGIVDAIGHLMIVAILFVLIVRGPTDAREMLILWDKSLFTEAYFMTGLYFLAFVMIFILYYGIHFMCYGV